MGAQEKQAWTVGPHKRTKIEYFECKFNDVTHKEDVEVRTVTEIIPKRGSFKYLRSIIQGNGEIDDDVTHRIWSGTSYIVRGEELTDQELALPEDESKKNEDIEMDVWTQMCDTLAMVGRRRGRCQPKKYWKKVISQDMTRLQLTEDIILDRSIWRLRIRVEC
ncbi:hypothetical protein H5410_021938 [Solanum commersonii]|uniref:Uncharacterized protein n=1 Tax=Solanum commersonii TaxID=4109 RepID=A0A9J5ZCS1_SOLCO|nr:hypothetical protein H5410_021938 [Solanum commersonii]